MNEHRNHSYWRGEIKILDQDKKRGYFRWGDEPADERRKTRFIELRNIGQIIDPVIYQPFKTAKESQSSYESDSLLEESNPLKEIRKFRKSYQNLRKTEREAVVQSRIGQGVFRESLINYWQSCSITNCIDFSLLRASHIKPWRVSNNQERLDVHNGLLLIPNLDLAFDKGLITFSHSGKIIISDHLDAQTCKILGILPLMKLKKVDKSHLPYLAFHRAKVFKG